MRTGNDRERIVEENKLLEVGTRLVVLEMVEIDAIQIYIEIFSSRFIEKCLVERRPRVLKKKIYILKNTLDT